MRHLVERFIGIGDLVLYSSLTLALTLTLALALGLTSTTVPLVAVVSLLLMSCVFSCGERGWRLRG